MRQRHGGERRQGVGAVQGVVHPLTAPPPGGNYSRRGGGDEGKGGDRRETSGNQCIRECFVASAADLRSARAEMKFRVLTDDRKFRDLEQNTTRTWRFDTRKEAAQTLREPRGSCSHESEPERSHTRTTAECN